MLYNNIPELLKILKKENLYSEKKFGQNFLCNNSVIDKIIESAEIKKTDTIIEVGPGLGILTKELLERAGKVIAIELDPKLIPYLKAQFFAYSNLEVIHQDVLKSSIPSFPYKVIANIPYYITSPIISHYVQALNPPELMVLLVQLEVAQKITAKPGDHNVLSLQTQIYAEPSMVTVVKSGSFFPAPKVDSAVIKLKPHSKQKCESPELFIKLIHKAFSQKRKTLANSLQTFQNLSKAEVTSLLEKAQIPALARPQSLDIEDFNRLLKLLN